MEGELEVENIQANPKMAGNPHDLIGIKGIIEAQNTEIKMKIHQMRIENEQYFRSHPEIETMISRFVKKVLDERPENILQFAGVFFDRPDLKEFIEGSKEQELLEEKQAASINQIIATRTSSILEK